MLPAQTIEELTALAQRFCAVESSEDGSVEQPEGHFTLFQGKSSRASKAARSPIKWTTFERTAAELIRRVRQLASNGEGHVFVRAYLTGSTSPEEIYRVDGSTAELDGSEDDSTPTDGGAIATLVGALVTTNKSLLRDNTELRDRVTRNVDERMAEREQLVMSVMHNHMLESSNDAAQWSETIKVLGPTLEAVAPKVVDAILKAAAGASSGAAALPTEPLPAATELIKRTGMAAAAVGAHLQAHPEVLAQVDAGPLYMIVQQLAGALGLTVTGYPSPGVEA